MNIRHMKELDLKGKRVVIREDLNVPAKDGCITSDARLLVAIPTIQLALDQGAAVVLLSHLGRPKEGEFEEKFSLKPVGKRLSELLHIPVKFIDDISKPFQLGEGQCALCENVRFLVGEKANDKELAKKLAGLGDVYVMDAFATAHRAHASTEGALHFAKEVCVGPLMNKELDTLTCLLEMPSHPLLAIVGGAKVSTKLEVLGNLITKVDSLIVGGGIANTFLKAKGFTIGKSLCENDLLEAAKRILQEAKERNVDILLPKDVVVAKEFSESAPSRLCDIDEVQPDEMILDIGPESLASYQDVVAKATMIVWNGPVGAFEMKPFSHGTVGLAQSIAQAEAYSIVGGGDSIAALQSCDLMDKVDYVSTAGGAFLDMLGGKALPSVAALKSLAGC